VNIYYLIRQASAEQGTFGIITDSENTKLCVTAERPWLNNLPNVSCIPVGTYTCVSHSSPDHPGTWEVANVPNRSEILIHNGNFPLKDSEGCILVGEAYSTLYGVPIVTNSVLTLEHLRRILPSTFTLIIKEA